MFSLVEERKRARAEGTAWTPRTWKRASLALYALSLAGIITCQAVQLFSLVGTVGQSVTVELARGTFTFLDFKPKAKLPRALILFGSGDGGWNLFEEDISRTLQGRGYEVIGIDFARYAASDYDLRDLQSDSSVMAQKEMTQHRSHTLPLIVAGYSMGAAQAIAIAGGPHPPPGMVGLLLIDPLSRGRFGLRLTDRTNIPPTGKGTFAVADFTGSMRTIRVVQWHAMLDPIDSRAWLSELRAPHKEFDFAQTGHSYTNDRADFLNEFADSVSWILQPSPPVTILAPNGGQP